MAVHRLYDIRSLQEKRGWGSYGGHSCAHNFVLVVIDYCIKRNVLMNWEYIWEKGPICNFSCHEI